MGNNGNDLPLNGSNNLYVTNNSQKKINNRYRNTDEENKVPREILPLKNNQDLCKGVLDTINVHNLLRIKSKKNTKVENDEMTKEEVLQIKRDLDFENESLNISSKENSPSCNLISERFEVKSSQIPKKPKENLITKAKNRISTALEDENNNPINFKKFIKTLNDPPLCNLCNKRYNSPINSNILNQKNFYCIGKIIKASNYTYVKERSFPYGILYEQYLVKFSGGVNQVKLRRFCRLTRDEFQYFKDRYTAEMYDTRPLVAIPLFCIKYARLINIPEEEKSKVKGYESKNNFLFEIYAPQLNLIIHKNNPSRTPSHSHIIAEMNFNKTLNRQEIDHNQNSFSPFDNRVKTPISRSNHNISFKGNNTNISSNAYLKQGILFKNEEEALNFNYFSMKKGKELAIPLKILENKEYLFNKSFNKKQTRSSRELDLYLSETRFIFSSNNLDECLKFVYLINWLKQ